MGAFTTQLRNKTVDKAFGGTDYTPPATYYMGFSTTTVQNDGSGITEPVGNGYARVAITNNVANFPSASNGAKTNGTQFQSPAATGAWGTITDVFFADAASGGVVWGFAAIAPATIVNGQRITLAVGQLTIQVT